MIRPKETIHEKSVWYIYWENQIHVENRLKMLSSCINTKQRLLTPWSYYTDNSHAHTNLQLQIIPHSSMETCHTQVRGLKIVPPPTPVTAQCPTRICSLGNITQTFSAFYHLWMNVLLIRGGGPNGRPGEPTLFGAM